MSSQSDRSTNQSDIDLFNFGAGFVGQPEAGIDAGNLHETWTKSRPNSKYVGNSASGNNSPIKGPFTNAIAAIKLINSIK